MKSPAVVPALRAMYRASRLPLVALAVLAAGCQTAEQEWREGPSEQDAIAIGSATVWREVAMNRQWQQQPFSKLRVALGEPVLVLDIPGGGNPPGMVAVCQLDRATGCRDAFALMFGHDPVIRLYHCR